MALCGPRRSGRHRALHQTANQQLFWVAARECWAYGLKVTNQAKWSFKCLIWEMLVILMMFCCDRGNFLHFADLLFCSMQMFQCTGAILTSSIRDTPFPFTSALFPWHFFIFLVYPVHFIGWRHPPAACAVRSRAHCPWDFNPQCTALH